MEPAQYGELKSRLLHAFMRLESLAERRQSSSAKDAARRLSEKLGAERFVVVVVGEFKRGKSTFVNALLGAPVLPTGVVPLTSVVTTVSYGERPGAEVAFRDGRTDPICIDRISAYVTERENPRNRLGVERVAVSYPSGYLADGVVLVDTPGVGSVHIHNTEAARAFIPEADAAIFLTCADPPISAAERAFLADVQGYAAKMFFVSNKIDYLSEPDRAESLSFTRGVLAEALGKEPALYAVSARAALQARVEGDAAALQASGLAGFERDFRAFLMRDKGRSLLRSVAMAAGRTVSDERNSLAIEQAPAELPLEDLRRRAREMECLFEEALERKGNIRARLRSQVEALVATVEADLEELRTSASSELGRQARLFFQAERSVRTAPGELEEQIHRALRAATDRWRAAEEAKVAAELGRRLSRAQADADDLVAATVRLCAGVMEVDLATPSGPPVLSGRSRFSYHFEKAPGSLDGILPDLSGYLPRRMAMRRLLKEVERSVPRLVDRQCGRLRWDFAQRLEESLRAAGRDTDARVDTTVDSLRLGTARVLALRDSSAQDARQATGTAGSLRAELDRIDGELQAVLTATGVGGPGLAPGVGGPGLAPGVGGPGPAPGGTPAAG